MCCICRAFPLEILFPIIHPMKMTVANRPIDTITLEVKSRGTTPLPGDYNVTAYAEVYNSLSSLAYLRFYEQHESFLRLTFGGDVKQWPPLFQFAWVVRNGIVHHGGRVNFTSPSFPAVTWHTFTYSPADSGTPIFGAHFSVADMFMLLIELSDGFDALGAPFPSD
jgi:hypothetical protein